MYGRSWHWGIKGKRLENLYDQRGPASEGTNCGTPGGNLERNIGANRYEK